MLPDSCVELLRRMVAVDTVNPHYGGTAGGQAELARQLTDWGRQWGLRSREFPLTGQDSNLLLFHESAPDAPWLLLDSHLDTVSVAGMSIAPFELTEKAGHLYGRGTCDTKGSGAAMLWALQDYARSPRAALNVGVLFTRDEESTMAGARAFARQGLAEFLPRLRGIVVGEPTGMHPVIATNGLVRWRTIARGVAAHSSNPSKGRSAISEIVRAVAAFEKHYVPQVTAHHRLTGRAAASINVIAGGSQVNIIPDYCEIHCDRRLIPGETAEVALVHRDAVWAELPGLEHDLVYPVAPLPESACERLHQWAAPAYTAAGLDPTGRGAAYVTNGSIYAEAGAQVLVLGPGHAAQAHTHNEWVAVDQLTLAAKAYRALMALG